MRIARVLTANYALAVALLLVMSAGVGWANDRIVALQACPDTKTRFVCMVLPFEWHRRLAFPVIHRRVSADEVLHVRGHLLHQPSRIYRLSVDPREDTLRGLWAGNAISSFAYVGRSKENRPIILTDRGPFEIEAPYIDVSGTPGLIVVDGKKRRVVARYFPFDDGVFVVNGPRDVAIWDVVRSLCIVAPRRRPGLLRLGMDKCGTFDSTANGSHSDARGSATLDDDEDHQFNDLILATNVELPTSSRDVTRIRGTNYYVMHVELEDICGTDDPADTAVESLSQPGEWWSFLD